LKAPQTSLSARVSSCVTSSRNPDHQTITWEFENAHSLHKIYAQDEGLLRTMEQVLDIMIVTRDGWFQVDGTPGSIKKVQHVIERLMALQTCGMKIGKDEFLETLQDASLEHAEPGSAFRDAPTSIQCSYRKPKIFPKSQSQRRYLRMIDEHDITFGIGPAGTGKTYLAMAKAVSALKQETMSTIILTRPAVEAGEALGFLPGELQEKIFPYLRPLYDALHDMLEPEEIQRYLDKDIIQIAPLAYMRGRTLSNAFIILDESQNTTTEQMFMFLTRIGSGSRCVITGDPTQIDLPRNKPSGLIDALEALKSLSSIGFHYFQESDVVRHSLVKAIIHAYQEHRAHC
jgi:phosphate starvation-inducible PhoH-like protein